MRELLEVARSGTLALPPEGPRFHYTYRARGALYQLFRGLASGNGSEVLVPAFHCTTVVDPILHAGQRVRFYDVTEELGIDLASLRSALTPRTAAVVVINYFGIEADLGALNAVLASHSAVLVEDCSHAFVKTGPLRLAGGRGDASVYSFWKTVACLVGGAYRTESPRLRGVPQHGALPLGTRLRHWKRLLDAYADGKPDALPARVYAGLKRWRTRGRLHTTVNEVPAVGGGESQYPYDDVIAAARCPAFARRILRCADIASIVEARRRNFLLYTQQLVRGNGLRPLFRALPDGVSPWGFPVLMRQRECHDHRLEAAGVPVFTFGEMPHRLLDGSPGSFPVSRRFSAELLVLPVHQDLAISDVERFCQIINAHFGDGNDGDADRGVEPGGQSVA